MEIEYLQLMEKTEVVYGSKNYPKSIDEINELELKTDQTFPKAYKEFLLIGGEYNNLKIVNSSLNDGINRQERVHETLAEENLIIEGGDFWVICDLDGGEQFDFFYFNDPDAEDPENPPVYVSYPVYLDEGMPLKKKIANSFSEYIEEKIRAYI